VSITPESARGMYRTVLTDSVTVRRLTGTGANQTPFDALHIPARVMGYTPDEIAGTIQQGDRKVIVLADALTAKQWPEPVKKGDRIILADGRTTTVESVDQDSKRVAGVLIAYVLQVRGQ
jgi:hypothetical protein